MSKKPDLKSKYKQLEKEAAIQAREEEHKKQESLLDSIYGSYGETCNAADEKSTLNAEDLSDDWENLRRIAKVKFPEGAKFHGLTMNNRLVAVASCLGWTQAKIAKASKLNPSTVSRWLNRPDIKLFMEEFNMKNGSEDTLKKVSELEYEALACVKNILNDYDTSDAAKRLKFDAAKWVYERTRGKAPQTVVHEGNTLGDLFERLAQLNTAFADNIDEDEEKELFH